MRWALVALVLGTALPVGAQSASEAQLWASGQVRVRPAKGLWLGFTQHLRWDNDLNRFRKAMPEVGARYRVARFLRLGAGYRFILIHDQNDPDLIGHRVYGDVRPSYRAGPARFTYRLRAQYTTEPRTVPTDPPGEFVLRNRLGIGFDTDMGLSPYLNAEVFVQVGGADAGLAKWRLTLGVPYEFGPHEVDIFYRLQKRTDPLLNVWHILGFSYRFSIK